MNVAAEVRERPYPVLYSFRRCPFAMRARLALCLGGETAELREVVLRDKPSHMLALSPKGTVPVLWLQDGSVIDESLDIMGWVGKRNPAKLALPDETDAELIVTIDTAFKYHLDRYKYASRYPQENAVAHRDACAAILEELQPRLTDDWLGGASPGFADIAILPFVRQFRSADAGWFDICTELARARIWLARFSEWPLLAAVMQKYKPWAGEGPGVLLQPPANCAMD
ncbi:MAG: glutathione S-transferase [Beijerinckiaceae bacterium]